jgi:uncharacterized protein (DUF488 family)
MNGESDIWTIGHSTRNIDSFVELLSSHEIQVLADVRRYPGSRKYPHFNREPLAGELDAAGIQYESFSDLGGRRSPRPDSQNTAWRNAAFRGYADFMDTGEFHAAIDRLSRIAGVKRTAIMCAEALWWRCHRSLIADFLKSAGWNVIHILDSSKDEPHRYSAAASIVNDKLSYSLIKP